MLCFVLIPSGADLWGSCAILFFFPLFHGGVTLLSGVCLLSLVYPRRGHGGWWMQSREVLCTFCKWASGAWVSDGTRVVKEVFQLSWGTNSKAALEMANVQSYYYFSGGKGSFLSLPDGLQQKELERLVSCRNQSSSCHIVCWLSLVGLGSYLVFGLACRHKRLLEMEKRRKRDRKVLSPFSIKCPVYRQSEEGHQTLHKSMRPETRWFFFKSDLSALGGYLSRSAWHLWLKFRKGVKLSVQNKTHYPSFDEEWDFAWFHEHSRSRPALRPCQPRAWQCLFTAANGIAAASCWLSPNGYVVFQCLGKVVRLNIAPFSGLTNFLSSVLERRGKSSVRTKI